MRDKSDLYFECHVTIDPVFDENRERLEEIVSNYNFKLAKLVMIKETKGSGGEYCLSSKDTFFTAHSKSYSDLLNRMIDCIKKVQIEGYVVRRYKIEDTIIDSRSDDIIKLLD